MKQTIYRKLTIAAVTLLFAFGVISNSAIAAETSPQQWEVQKTKIKGEWHIEHREDGAYIVLSDKFKTRSAPDLKLFFSKQMPSELNGKNATSQSIFISELQSNKGGQSFKIPASVNIADYQSILLHCEKYSKLWGASKL